MRPNARVWRKTRRDAEKGIPTGRRATHRAETQEPIPGSTWSRRQHAKTPPGQCARYTTTEGSAQ